MDPYRETASNGRCIGTMGAVRKRKAAPLDKAKGWKQVKVGDDLMLGSTEGGFMGLEVLEPEETLLFGHHKRQAATAPDAEDQDMLAEVDEVATNRKPKKSADKPQSKKTKLSEPVPAVTPTQGTDSSSTLDLLNAKIAALQAENSALKARSASKSGKPAKMDKATTKAQKLDKPPKSDKAAKKASKSKVTATGPVTKINDDADASAAVSQIDMSAWSEFDLHPKIAAAIAQAGFAQPTPIQQQCLLPAIRDQRDVIGAAQTVRPLLCSSSISVVHSQMSLAVSPAVGLVPLAGQKANSAALSLEDYFFMQAYASCDVIPAALSTMQYTSYDVGVITLVCGAGLWQDSGIWAAHHAAPDAAERGGNSWSSHQVEGSHPGSHS